MKRLFAVAALVMALLAAGGAVASPGDVVLRSGAIYTLDAKHPWASALVVSGGRIAYVGSDAGAGAYAGKDAHVISLSGRMVLPGFHDAHAHPMSAGLRLLRCRLDDLKSAAEIHTAVRACDRTVKEDWLFASGWSPALAPASLGTLDELVPDRPAYLATEDGFSVWVNSRTLAAAGIDPKTSGIKGLERDPVTHLPTGVVRDDALTLVRKFRPQPTEARFREAFRRWSERAHKFGITSVFDAAASAPMVEAYHAADQAGELGLRVVAAQLVDTKRGPEQVDEMITRRDSTRGLRFRADAAKIFLDGEIGMHTAALLQPYADTPGSRGELFVQPDALDALVRRLDAAGFMIHMHVMGDRAVRAGLDSIEQALAANGEKDRRHQLAHVGMADPANLPRFGRLGVTANLSPGWFQASDPAMAATEAVLDPQRRGWMYPAKSIASGGGRIVLSSDWPATSMNPLDNIQIAVTRQPLDGSKPAKQPQERIDLATALAAYTREAAWVAREDAVDGSLEVGKAADLIVLDRNLFKTPVGSLRKARVLLTLLDGEPVYKDRHFGWPRPADD
jgi:predicted amidohydrolase YtcJ